MDNDFLIERNILKIGHKVLTRRSDDLKLYDLTPNQSETLLFFDRHAEARILDLKDYLKISHQAARNIVERMKEKGLLRMAVSDVDARARKITLTERGRLVCDKLKEKGTHLGNDLLRTLSEEEKRQLALLLDKIMDNI